MTEKLYYKDAYIKEFSAKVISCVKADGVYEIELDRTAFFPEEGGQYSDKGRIGNARVDLVLEKEGRIIHYALSPASVGDTVECAIDFPDRYEKMQCHTAEHILSGLFHKCHRLNNVGFHLGEHEVTMDIDGVLTRDELDAIELAANRIVYENRCVKTAFPASEELEGLEYRSKLDLKENVRLVEIDGVDVCACCAPHVASTGEIGIIKMLDFVKHKGGIRINILAGMRALVDYEERYKEACKLSALLSAPQSDLFTPCEKLLSDYEALKTKYRMQSERCAILEAELIQPREGNVVALLADLDTAALRAFAQAAVKKVSGCVVALSAKADGYNYVIMSDSIDLGKEAKNINTALCGKGGGKGVYIQGSFASSLEKIKEYFK